MTQSLISIGLLLIAVCFIVVIIGAFFQSAAQTNTETKVAFGGFIGPIPFGFMNDSKLLVPMLILMSVALVLFYVLRN